MSKCHCSKFQGGRGSGIGYMHDETKRIVQFDGPHPGNELYKYQIEKMKQFINEIAEKGTDRMKSDMMKYKGYKASIAYDEDGYSLNQVVSMAMEAFLGKNRKKV